MPPQSRWGIKPVSRPRLKAGFGVFVCLVLFGVNAAFIRHNGQFYPALFILGSGILPICLLNVVVGQPFDDDGLPQRWYVALFYALLVLGVLLGLFLSIRVSDF